MRANQKPRHAIRDMHDAGVLRAMAQAGVPQFVDGSLTIRPMYLGEVFMPDRPSLSRKIETMQAAPPPTLQPVKNTGYWLLLLFCGDFHHITFKQRKVNSK